MEVGPDEKTGAAGAWHVRAVAEVVAALDTDPDVGLAAAAAADRLARHGPNELRAAARTSPWAILLAQLRNVLILVLIVAVGLSLLLGHTLEAVAIGAIIVFAVGLGFAQEFRAERAIEALREMAAPLATVLRDGVERDVPSRDVVPGDVILLRAGHRVPADARLVEAANLRIEEAVLTGESEPVEKDSAALPATAAALGDRRNMAYAGTIATYGRGRAVVVATGADTEFGRIAQLLETVETERTPLQENLDRVGHKLVRAAVLVVALVVALGALRGQPWLEMVIFGIALAVAVVPEALPAVVTISLAIGVQRMARRHALVRRLPAVETLGCTSIICSDKTGTLTKDEMTVRRIVVAGRVYDVSGSGYAPQGEFLAGGTAVAPPPPLRLLLQAAALSSDAQLVRDAAGDWHVSGDPTEGALVVAAAKAGLQKAELDARWPRVGEVPFTAESKCMLTLHEGGEGRVVYAKGAPEVILARAGRWVTDDGEAPLPAAARDAVLEQARAMANEALRVLAVGYRQAASLAAAADGELVLIGLVGMMDPPRPEAQAAIATCVAAGIKPVMITGDHPLTARAVARELRILQGGRVVTGAELGALDDAALAREVEGIDVYARVSPADKLRVVSALQARGHCVAMTGDGVNDAPALKKAAIGIAMGITGTDVSKEAAAMTLTDDNFASIVAAVEEGRAVFDNIKKYLMYLLSSNVGEILLMAGAVITGLPLPLSAVQILYVNLATDGLPALALAVDPAEEDLMRRPPRDPRVGVFTRPVVVLMLAGGLWSAGANLLLFAWALQSGRPLAEAMTMTFVSLVLIQFFKAYNYRSDRRSLFHRPFANRWLNRAIIWELALLALIVHLPVLQEPFGTYRLPWQDWALAIGLALSVSPVLELVKWLERRGWFGAGGANGAAAVPVSAPAGG